jgi:hypothetical protein
MGRKRVPPMIGPPLGMHVRDPKRGGRAPPRTYNGPWEGLFPTTCKKILDGRDGQCPRARIGNCPCCPAQATMHAAGCPERRRAETRCRSPARYVQLDIAPFLPGRAPDIGSAAPIGQVQCNQWLSSLLVTFTASMATLWQHSAYVARTIEEH